jgi:hypothetical protein
MNQMLFKTVGRRVALLFGGVCGIAVAILTALYLTASYSIENYVSEQLRKLPWDVAALQRGSERQDLLQNKLKQIPGVQEVGALGVLRIQRGNGTVGLEVDGVPVPARWLVMIAASDQRILPPELRRSDSDALWADRANGIPKVQAALVTGSRASADPVRVNQNSLLRVYGIPAPPGHGAMGHTHGGGPEPSSAESDDILFEASVATPPAQIERAEFNKWLLNNVGSLSYLPEHAVVVAVPLEVLDRLAPELDKWFLTSEGVHGGDAAPPYLPEMTHLLRLDRDQWVSTWNLEQSLKSISPLLQRVSADAKSITPFSYVHSDLQLILSRMASVSDLVGLVTLLVAIPLLWLTWVVAQMLGRLLLMNERRLIGLTLIRGVPMDSIGRTLLAALAIGGFAGGLLGLVVGVALPVAGHSLLLGRSMPTLEVFARGLIYVPFFLGLGILLAIMSGFSMIKQIRSMTPREALARGANELDRSSALSRLVVIASVLALLLGGYKVACWAAGRSLLGQWLQPAPDSPLGGALLMVEWILNFIAVPLFLFGVAMLLRWRLTWFQKIMNALAAPLVGNLRWFVAEHMALSRHRIASTFFLTSLATSLVLLPQVAADSFYNRMIRGVQASVGADVQIEYSLADLAGGRDEPGPVPQYDRLVKNEVQAIKNALAKADRVESVSVVQQYVVPGIYLPVQTGLMLNLIEDPKQYLDQVYFEEGMGYTRPFSEIIGDSRSQGLAASQGFLQVRQVPLKSDIAFGYSDQFTPLNGQVDDIVAFLPGQPGNDVEQREGYVAAEVDYLNYVTTSDARLISSVARFTSSKLSSLKVLPSRAVFLVGMRGEVGSEEIAELTAGLAHKPQDVRWVRSEEEKLGKDMFISLVLGNMKVFVIGGLVLAVVGIFVVGLTNFIAEKRTFSLLRLRGLPFGVLLRVSLSMFLVPVLAGILLGSVLGAISGYGLAQAIWELPRIYGVAGFLSNQLVLSGATLTLIIVFALILGVLAVGLSLWPWRQTVRQAIRE